MPFLRRRGNMASESDMRRHTPLDNAAAGPPRRSLHRAPWVPRPESEDAAIDGSPEGISISSGNNGGDSGAAASVQTSGDQASRPESRPIQEETLRHRRFSALRFRNASDSQLALRAKQHAEKPPPLPPPPSIITTAPTVEMEISQKKQGRIGLSSRFRRSVDAPRGRPDDCAEGLGTGRWNPAAADAASKGRQTLETFEEDDPAVLTIPEYRQSESSRSDASSTGHEPYPSVAAPASQVQRPARFFRLRRRKSKPPEPLFPLSHLPQKGKAASKAPPPWVSNSSLNVPGSSPITSTPERDRPGDGTPRASHASRPSSVHSGSTAFVASECVGKSSQSPAAALFRPGSTHSGQSSPSRVQLRLRGRSSTMSSISRDSVDGHPAPPTTRTSTSTGRKSFGDLFGLGRLRQNSDIALGRHGQLTPATPGSSASKNNSLQLAREAVVLPERREDDTPAKYLARLEEEMSRGVIASALSKGTDPFSAAVLRSYMRSFSFFGDPMDMAIRKLLMEAELPKETQQIDRCLQAFANRYHECNPGIYASPDQAYFVAFSLLILHTDVFNKNNKHKMQKADYLKNTRGEGIFDEILECFYDNITYTPFIHVEGDIDISGDRTAARKAKRRTIFPGHTPDTPRRAYKEPLDPYTIIIDGQLDMLRPNLKEVMHLDDHYNYLGTAKRLNLQELHKTFFRTGILQIVSARSRPDAFMSEKTATNPEEAHPGIVDIKITKVGLLWRKDAKKKKTRSPWQEWGAILTGAQLYFFRNTAWVKNLMHQYESHIKQGHDGIPIIFKPPLEQFKPDALISTDGAVALLDSTYKKHKHAFTYVRQGGFEEVLLADDEDEMNDWLAKLNYAAAFRTSGVRMRGVVGGNYDGQSRRAIRRLDSSDATQLVQTPTGEVSIARGRIDFKMAEDILAARREIMVQKVSEANEKLAASERQLDDQLRNARHLQILAPIEAKTRDQLLLSAAKMSAQLKWARMEIWKVRCHRDILLMDLDEERQHFDDAALRGLGYENHEGRDRTVPVDGTHGPPAGSLPPLGRQRSPSTATPTVTARRNEESPPTDVFQTPPTSARLDSKPSWGTSDAKAAGRGMRNGSVSSSGTSSGLQTLATPPSRHATNKDATTKSPRSTGGTHGDEVDAGEQDLLEQAGLIASDSVRGREKQIPAAVTEAGEASGHREAATPSDKLDRSKIRRSLQRTLREGAGHLSHHRTRHGKDSVSSHASEGTVRDEILSRGSGSFVVHGKKASVINFGSELQRMTQEEQLRQRKQMLRDGQQPPSPVQSHDGEGQASTNESASRRERTESSASTNTATARSFRELHRKYSSAQSSRATSSGGRLTVTSDGESEAAVSSSEGRRTPLPPIEPDSGSEAESRPVSRSRHQSQFHTPEPGEPGSPDSASVHEEAEEEEDDTASEPEAERSPRPGQAVKA